MRWQPKSAIVRRPTRCGASAGARVVGSGVEGFEGLDLGEHRLADLTRREELAEPATTGSGAVVRNAQPHAVARAAAIMRSQPEGSRAIGFSQRTCLPASAAATACSAWSRTGVAR